MSSATSAEQRGRGAGFSRAMRSFPSPDGDGDFGDICSVVFDRPARRSQLRFKRGGEVRQVAVRLGSGRCRRSVRPQVQARPVGHLARRRVPITRRLSGGADAAQHTLGHDALDRRRNCRNGQRARSTKEIGGPIRIAQIAGQGASLGFLPFVQLVALLSINLGFINLLPVPMLDGGHLFFYGVEAVRRRPLSAHALEWAFRSGLALIVALVLFTTVNDLGSLGLWERLQRLIG